MGKQERERPTQRERERENKRESAREGEEVKARKRMRERGNSSSVFCGHNTTEGERE